MTPEEFKAAFPVIQPVTVAWGEMDAFQHVNNVVYLRYFESARIAYLEAMGLSAKLEDKNPEQQPIGPILADNYCRYRRPVTFPDQLFIGCKITELHEFGFSMEYQAYSAQQKTVATKGTSRVVMINYVTGEKVAMNDDLLARIKKIQALP
ncbi:thioesterase family protein [Kangiella sp. TOML190]|uniref:acyl-CoA thioesterase n=1 Tax=Kangiella sp. TOML190 TaxID=2931351 RepID=UPI00203FA113|nr:thioesterase family protein [Kangiella sp. TOML190]